MRWYEFGESRSGDHFCCLHLFFFYLLMLGRVALEFKYECDEAVEFGIVTVRRIQLSFNGYILRP